MRSAAAALAVAHAGALASPELAQQKTCMACHAVDTKIVGPSYKDVATKYAGQRDAVEVLAAQDHQGRLGRLGRGADAGQPAGQCGRSQEAGGLGAEAEVGDLPPAPPRARAGYSMRSKRPPSLPSGLMTIQVPADRLTVKQRS